MHPHRRAPTILVHRRCGEPRGRASYSREVYNETRTAVVGTETGSGTVSADGTMSCRATGVASATVFPRRIREIQRERRKTERPSELELLGGKTTRGVASSRSDRATGPDLTGSGGSLYSG